VSVIGGLLRRTRLCVCVVSMLAFASMADAGQQSRDERAAQARGLLEQGKEAEAAAIMKSLVAEHLAWSDDAVLLAMLTVNTGQLPAATQLFEDGLALDESGRSCGRYNPSFFLALDREANARQDEALPLLIQATRHATFTRALELHIDDPLTKDADLFAERFEVIAKRLERAGAAGESRMYRRIAAAALMRTGFWAARSGEYGTALEKFAKADALTSLDEFAVDVRMTVYRDLAMSYALTAQWPHALAAADKLFELCHADHGVWNCPPRGVASDTLGAIVFSLDEKEHPVARPEQIGPGLAR
jgi:tetratricopeptide (TPR) repeat protein